MSERGFLSGVRRNRASSPFSERAELAALLAVERAWLAACVSLGSEPPSALQAYDDNVSPERIDLDALRDAAARDGIVVPELVRELRACLKPEHAPSVHRGATSQDIADTALVLQLREWFAQALVRHDAVAEALVRVRSRAPSSPTMAYTRMQPALPMSWASRLDSWDRSLRAARRTMEDAREAVAVVQVGGPVGDRRGDLDALAPVLAAQLGLRDPGGSWHTDRAPITRAAHAILGVSTALAKIGADVSLLALMGDVDVESAGRSSSMPHKRNPVQAELVVGLSSLAQKYAAAVMEASVQPLERSGAAWSLERWALEDLCLATTRASTVLESVLDGAVWHRAK